MTGKKLDLETFMHQFHDHERHMKAQDHSRPFSHEVPEFSTGGYANPDYRRKKKQKTPVVDHALRILQ